MMGALEPLMNDLTNEITDLRAQLTAAQQERDDWKKRALAQLQTCFAHQEKYEELEQEREEWKQRYDSGEGAYRLACDAQKQALAQRDVALRLQREQRYAMEAAEQQRAQAVAEGAILREAAQLQFGWPYPCLFNDRCLDVIRVVDEPGRCGPCKVREIARKALRETAPLAAEHLADDARMREALENIAARGCGIPGHSVAVGCGSPNIARAALAPHQARAEGQEARCGRCGGSGVVDRPQPSDAGSTDRCPICHGSGKQPEPQQQGERTDG